MISVCSRQHRSTSGQRLRDGDKPQRAGYLSLSSDCMCILSFLCIRLYVYLVSIHPDSNLLCDLQQLSPQDTRDRGFMFKVYLRVLINIFCLIPNRMLDRFFQAPSGFARIFYCPRAHVHHYLAPAATRSFSASPACLAKKKMPPKKAAAPEKKILLGRPSNNLKIGIVGLFL